MRYKATGPKDQIDAELCLVQAASALDAAAERAEQVNDVEGLLNVSAMWIKFSEAVENFARYKQEESPQEIEGGKLATGFQASAKGEISD